MSDPTTPAPCELESLLSQSRLNLDVLTSEERKKIEEHLLREPPCDYCKEKLKTILIEVTADKEFLDHLKRARERYSA